MTPVRGSGLTTTPGEREWEVIGYVLVRVVFGYVLVRDVCFGVCVDKPMQMNQALFMLGGGSGFVPHPDVMRDDSFDPFDKETLRLEPITIQLQV